MSVGTGAIRATGTSPTVLIELNSDPENVILVRGMLMGIAESFALDDELLWDMKTAVSEACNNVSVHAYGKGRGPLSVGLYVEQDAIDVIVCDDGGGFPSRARPRAGSHGVGVSVIQALTDRAQFGRRPIGGTEVRMTFGMHGDGQPARYAATCASRDHCELDRLSGDVVVSLSPVSLLPTVLGRLIRTLAARANFSLERLSDCFVVTDALAEHAAHEAIGARVGCGFTAADQRLELTIGPFRSGSGNRLQASDSGASLLALADELSLEPSEGGESVHVALTG
jgi:anti-sigma regulatory factor (Ser/Thr protein kinase)